MSTPPECHLFIIFARTTHQAVIFRRGPYLWTQLILWDTNADTFTEGQWFKGKIYTERCDLSPDASKLICFVAKHYKGFKPNSINENNWTGISRPPYFTALARWMRSDTWLGGGYFEDDNTVYVADRVTKDEGQSQPPAIEIHVMATKYEIGVGSNIYHDLLL